jgi:AcrR family transcriptional regulator
MVKRLKQEQTEATRKALLKVARKLFAEQGFAKTATEEVVRRARVTRGALYHHFRDKQDLFKAVLDEEERRIAHKIAAVAMSRRDPWERLLAGSEAFLDACLDPAVQRIVLIDAPAVLGWAAFREIDEGYFLGAMKDTLQEAMDEGMIAAQPVDPLAHVLFGATHEAALLIAHAEDEPKARDEASAVMTRLLSGLRTSL